MVESDYDEDPLTTDGRLTFLYLHVRPKVEVGDVVVGGQKIAKIADIKSDAHLHFGVRLGSFGGGVLPDNYYREALPPEESKSCRSCGAKIIPPNFPENWIDPQPLLRKEVFLE